LEEIRAEMIILKGNSFNLTRADAAHAEAFRNYGIDLATLGADEAAERIRASRLREPLVAALDDWSWLRPRAATVKPEHLREVANRADGNEWRHRFRDLAAARDRRALEELADRPEVAKLPPVSAVLLGRALEAVAAYDKAVQVLVAAQE